jgi:hypothetical protein
MTGTIEAVSGVVIVLGCASFLLVLAFAAIALAARAVARRRDPEMLDDDYEPRWWPDFERQFEEWKRDHSGTS